MKLMVCLEILKPSGRLTTGSRGSERVGFFKVVSNIPVERSTLSTVGPEKKACIDRNLVPPEDSACYSLEVLSNRRT